MSDVLVVGGGQAVHDLFVVKYDETSGTYKIYDVFTTPGTPAVVTSPTRTTGKPATLSEVVESKFTPDDDWNESIEFDNYDSRDDLWEFRKVFEPNRSQASMPDYTKENGIFRKGSSTGYQVLDVSYLMKNEDKTPNEIFVKIVLADFLGSSMPISTKSGDYVKPTFKLKSATAEVAFTIPIDLFHQHASDPDSGLLDTENITALAPAIAKGRQWWEGYVEVPNTP